MIQSLPPVCIAEVLGLTSGFLTASKAGIFQGRKRKNAQSNQEVNLWYICLEFVVAYSEIAVHTTKYRETYYAFLCIAVEESFFSRNISLWN